MRTVVAVPVVGESVSERSSDHVPACGVSCIHARRRSQYSHITGSGSQCEKCGRKATAHRRKRGPMNTPNSKDVIGYVYVTSNALVVRGPRRNRECGRGRPPTVPIRSAIVNRSGTTTRTREVRGGSHGTANTSGSRYWVYRHGYHRTRLASLDQTNSHHAHARRTHARTHAPLTQYG